MKAYLPFLLVAGLAASLLGWLPGTGAVGERPSLSVFEKSAPQDTGDLRTIELAAREVADRVVPCTVSLHIGMAQGSGVIVSEDGYVLTAAHVVGQPGSDVEIRLVDGTVLKGKALGMNTVADAGLVKITDEGKWPFAALIPIDEGPEAGDWCLATGHPSGFQSDRSPPVRVGRVIDVTADVIRTDCVIMGGDSGGPLFDMQGRVIGIHSRISNDPTVNLHAPALACIRTWESMKGSQVFPASKLRSRFFETLDFDDDGQVTRAELPNDEYRGVFDRLAEKYNLDRGASYSIKELTQRLRLAWRPTSNRDYGRPYDEEERERVGESLMKQLFVRGDNVLKAFDQLVAAARSSTVQVECGGKSVALGTVVGADGWILTKASDLTQTVRCRLQNGRRFSAQVVGEDKQYDLALLRIEARDLTPVKFSETSNLQAGSWVLSPGTKGIESVGVLSVGQREIVGIPGVLGIQLAETDTAARIVQVFPNSGAEEVGMRPDDLITHLNGKAVHNIDELKKALKLNRAGDVVQVKIVRDDKQTELQYEVTLGAFEDIFFRFGRAHANGPMSRRRDGFPRAFQHDSVLDPAKCGGPVLDSMGQVVGINIARADRIATYSVPSEAITPILEKLKAAATATTRVD